VGGSMRVSGGVAELRAGDLSLRLDLADGARVADVTCAARPAQALVERWWCAYEADGQVWSEAPQEGQRAFGAGRARVTHSAAGAGGAAGGEVAVSAVAPHLRLRKRFTVYPGLPFVRVRYWIASTGVEGRGAGFSVGLPWVALTDALADAFDLPSETADDGMDLGDGLALPAWRAFGDPAGAFGLLVFAAERQVLSRMQVTGRGFAFRPPYYLSYSTNVVTTREARFGLEHQNVGPLDELDWFLGAFRRDDLPALLRLIGAFHARRRPAEWGGTAGAAGAAEVLEYAPGRSAWDAEPDDSAAPPAGAAPAGGAAHPALPPLEALPRPSWPSSVTVSPGRRATRSFVLPGGAFGGSDPGQAGTWSASGVTVSTRRDERRPGRLTLDVEAAGAAAPGVRSVSVPIPGGALEVVVEVAPPRPLPEGEGMVVIGAADLARRAGEAGWLVVDAPDLPGGTALLQRPGGGARPLEVDPGLRGSYDVFAGVGDGAGLKFALGEVGEGSAWSYVHADRTNVSQRVDIQTWQPVATLCRLPAGSGPFGEVLLRRATLGGAPPSGALRIAPHPYANGYTVLSHLRFAPAPPPVLPLLTGRRRSIVGLSDIPDVGNDLGADAYQEEAWREVVAQHARVGIDTVYWRVDGQCADFHSTIGTVRYSVPRTHSLYSPRARTYGRALERLDPLRIATDEAQRRGLRLFGWMRANNYSGNVVARFFVQHPEWHEVREDGSPAPQLCFAVPEVRAHKAAIQREAAAYGLQGLLIDTLRHPPMVGYHPLVVEAFRAEYGEPPPREPQTRLPQNRVDNRTGERWERWFRFRARYFAQFVRDLRAGLAADGLGDLPVHVRVAPQRYLHDGADLEALLDEGLIGAVVANRYVTDALDYERLFPVVRGRVPVIAICDPIRNDPVGLLAEAHADPLLGGVGLYESNRLVHTPPFRDALLEIARLQDVRAT
jgi:hypothetical protein